MKQLDDFTMKQATDYLIKKYADERNISVKQARKLFITAILYNTVVESIGEQIDFLLEGT